MFYYFNDDQGNAPIGWAGASALFITGIFYLIVHFGWGK
jgi:hypothetical protein